MPSVHFNPDASKSFRREEEEEDLGPVPKDPSVVTNGDDDDDDMPLRLQVTLPRSGSTIDVGVTPDRERQSRVVPVREERPSAADEEYRDVHVSNHPRLKTTEPPMADRVAREIAATRRARNARYASAAGEDVPLVVPLNLQLDALDEAVRSAVRACENMSRHRIADHWYDERDVRSEAPTSPIPLSNNVHNNNNVARLCDVDEKTPDNERFLSDFASLPFDVPKPVDASETKRDVAVRTSEAEIRAGKIVDMLDADLTACDVAATKEMARWQSLEGELNEAVSNIKNELAFFERVRSSMRDSNARRAISSEATISYTPTTREETEHEEDMSPPPPPPSFPPTPLTPRVLAVDSPLPGWRASHATSSLPPIPTVSKRLERPPTPPSISFFDSPLPPCSRLVRNAVTGKSPRLATLERQLAKAVAMEDFRSCQKIQRQIDALATRKRQVDREREQLHATSTALQRRIGDAVRVEDFGEAKLASSKLREIDGRFATENDDDVVRSPQRAADRRQVTIRKLEAQLATALKWENYEMCARIQSALAPLKETALRREHERDLVQNQIADLKSQLRDAMRIEDYATCQAIQKRIESLRRDGIRSEARSTGRRRR